MAQRQIARYSNGYVPLGRLIVIDRGYNGVDGNWEHRLPRATLRRWNRLVVRAARRRATAGLHPLALRITSGWCTDRPYAVQVRAKQIHGIYAATPGRSSHGGVFENQQTAAIDAGNYSAVYAGCGGYDAWLSDLRAEGFDRLPPGYPLDGERHHIIDYNPWDDEPEFGGATAGDGSTPFEEDDMLDHNRDYTAFSIMLQRALRFDVRPDGVGPSGAFGPTLWERLGQVEAAAQADAALDEVKAKVDLIAEMVLGRTRTVAPANGSPMPDDPNSLDKVLRRLQDWSLPQLAVTIAALNGGEKPARTPEEWAALSTDEAAIQRIAIAAELAPVAEAPTE